MNRLSSFPLRWLALVLLIPHFAAAQPLPVSVDVTTDTPSSDLAPHFLGLSYESSTLLPKDGHYYFNANERPLANTFRTLGIKSLRIGANAVDDPTVPVPQEKDIDALFNFARVAGVKVIYSFRLKNGNPEDSARLAAYIAAHDADVLECFAMGNEPEYFLKTYDAYFAQWKPHYDAILKAVPDAKFDGPSANPEYALKLAKDLFAEGHLAMASDHYYFMGNGRLAETNAPATRTRFLSNDLHTEYEKNYAEAGALLAAEGVPYRIDELNNCYHGGAKDASDTYASTLWALDCTHWWAAHHILGMNYHTGESVGRDGVFGPANYAAFIHQPDGHGFIIRPQSYGYLAFSQGAHGRALAVKLEAASALNFAAYAYQDRDGSVYVTLINKSYGETAHPAAVSLRLPPGTASGPWLRMDLTQKDADVAAKTGFTLGGASVDAQGEWPGHWKKIKAPRSGNATFQVAPASATLLHFSPALNPKSQ